MFYIVLLYSSRCGVFTLENTNTEITAAGNIGVSTLEDGTDTELNAVGINNTLTAVHNENFPPNE